jgi:hypothetical protein
LCKVKGIAHWQTSVPALLFTQPITEKVLSALIVFCVSVVLHRFGGLPTETFLTAVVLTKAVVKVRPAQAKRLPTRQAGKGHRAIRSKPAMCFE